jgi:hypothetical protein
LGGYAYCRSLWRPRRSPKRVLGIPLTNLPPEPRPKSCSSHGWAHFTVSPQSSGFIYFSVVDTLGKAVTDSIPVSVAAGAGDDSRVVRPFHAEPSVTRAGTRWMLEGPAEVGTSILIVSVDGRRVTTLTVPAGARDIVWPGTNERGKRVASGLYLAEFRSRTKTATGRVVVLH